MRIRLRRDPLIFPVRRTCGIVVTEYHESFKMHVFVIDLDDIILGRALDLADAEDRFDPVDTVGAFRIAEAGRRFSDGFSGHDQKSRAVIHPIDALRMFSVNTGKTIVKEHVRPCTVPLPRPVTDKDGLPRRRFMDTESCRRSAHIEQMGVKKTFSRYGHVHRNSPFAAEFQSKYFGATG